MMNVGSWRIPEGLTYRNNVRFRFQLGSSKPPGNSDLTFCLNVELAVQTC